MSWKKGCSLFLAAVLLLSLTAGCGGAKDTSGKMMRIATGAEPETLDPRKSTGIPEALIQNQIFEGLCSRDKNSNPVPGVAEKWDISDDGLKYVFHLRANAKWSNGDPVTAQDFEYAWKTLLSPEMASRYADQLYYLKNGAAYNKQQNGITADQVGVKALNDRTLEVTLEKPTAFFLALLGHHTYFPVHKKTVEANPDWIKEPATIISNGPFKMAAWVHNSKIELVKNEHYWDAGKLKLDKLDVTLSDNATTVLAMFENNQLDLAIRPEPPVAEVPRLLKENKLKIYPYLGIYYYAINVTKPPLDNVKLRQALALAIDRQAIVDNITRSGQIPAMALVPFGLSDAKAGEDFRKVGGDYFKDKDFATAKKLLAEAGYPDGKGLPALTILYNTLDQHKAIAEAIQEMWKKNLGIEVNLVNQEWKVYLASLRQGDYLIGRAGWIGDYTDPMNFADLLMTDAGNNHSKWSSKQYDDLVNQAKATLDPTSRMKAMHDAEKILMDEMPIIPIYFYTLLNLEKPNVKGIVRNVDGNVYLKEAFLE
ncbi:peptide ABC transporter substrate-binding protein [Acetonema longum]|uniref:Extracellular solute-binding protein family 5 n=1 Tax=Acetonema longum DSM 6540 TaxID=1009370 RepID=F7NGP2_9FIRM|nr:peptide ABC transporter substrate-binding protein [Acetonema longum]EGO64846.1 extracellular solute-binding protein family 5 [Acetonema longum DSM 6540]